MGTIVRKLTSAELKKLNPKAFAFKITIELGPAFANGKLQFTNDELAKAFEEAAACRKNSPIAPLLAHRAEHIRFDADHSSDKQKFLRSRAQIKIQSVYYGCDSCGEGSGFCVCDDYCELCC